MTFARAFGLFGLLILLACALVSVAASYVASYDGHRRNAWIWAWIGLHVALLALHPSSLILSNALVLGSAIGGGVLIYRTVPTPGALMALAVAASVADIISFTVGPTRWLLDPASGELWEGLPYLTVSLPMAERTVPVIGIGDLLLFAGFFLGLRRLGPGRIVSFTTLACGLLVALWVGLIRGGAFGIPFMAVGVFLLLAPSIRAGGKGEPA
jgi:hypothetical protein